MKPGRTFSRTLLFALALLFTFPVSPLWAQDVPALTQLAQVPTDDGLLLSVSYPKGWVTETTSLVLYLASSPSALEQVQDGEITDEDAVGIAIYLPEVLDQINLSRTTAPDITLAAFLAVAELEGDIQMLTNTSIPIAAGMVTLLDDPDDGGFVAALGFPTGTVIIAAQPSEAVDATVLAILDSITLTGGEAVPPNSTETPTSGETEATVISIEQPEGTFDLSFTLPEGWVFDYQASNAVVFIGTNPSAMAQASTSEPEFEPGDIAISLGLPAVLEQFGILSTATPTEILEGFMEFVGASGKVRTDASFGVPATQARSIGEDAGTTAEIYALQFDAGSLIIAVQPLGAVDDVVLALLHSIRFGEQGAEDDAPVAEGVRQWASSADGSSQYGSDGWSFSQATGEPDTADCGDFITAWASANSSTREYLILEFDQPVIPTQINVYQTFNPGAIVGISLGNTEDPDSLITLPGSADAPGDTPCPGVFSVDVTDVVVPVDFVVIYLDQTVAQHWNEIDAVELVGIVAE